MVYRNFNLSIIVRLLLIIATSIWFALEIDNPQKAYTKFFLLALIVIQSVFLILYFNKINKEIIRFLKLLKINDASYRFSSDLKGNFTELARILNNTADLLENTRIEKKKQYHFLQFVIQQINVGLIAYDKNGVIHFSNKSFSELLKLKWIKNLSDLESLDAEFYNNLKKSKPEDLFQNKLNIENSFQQFLIQKKQFKFNNELINLVSIQNISAELDRKELESWQKLIRVLTHEIMNSIAPITNLTYSIRRSLKENVGSEKVQKSVIDEAIEDTSIIESRSNSLMQFVENYRKLTKLGKVSFDEVNVKRLIENSVNIFKEEISNSNIELNLLVDDGIIIKGDAKLLEQAFINLTKNAIDALNETKRPYIKIKAELIENQLIISIEDNGSGIESDKIDDIFIPFYTSKENGSGIGLSLVKQIISIHKGIISVNSEKGKGSTFKITV